MRERLYREVCGWMHRNAREIELSVWKALFEQGSAEDVPRALAYYQNADGGFGHALEADCWNAHSSPYTTEYALKLLRSVGYAEMEHPVLQGIVRYLSSGAEMEPYGWRFVIPSNDDCPRAPWWTYDEAANRRESIGLTASLCAFALRHVDARAPLYATSLALGTALAQRLASDEDLGEMGIGGLIALVPALEAARVQGLDYAALDSRLHARVNRAIVRDPARWAMYGVRPSRYIEGPGSPFYAENAEIVQKELQYALETRADQGVWDIPWSWFDLTERYAAQFAVSERWWKAQTAIETMCFLRNFGMLKD